MQRMKIMTGQKMGLDSMLIPDLVLARWIVEEWWSWLRTGQQSANIMNVNQT